MKEDVFERAVELLTDQGHDASVYSNYSGRAMYGSTTTGIVADCSGVLVGWAIGQACREMEVEEYEAYELLPTRTDSMGLSTIYY